MVYVRRRRLYRRRPKKGLRPSQRRQVAKIAKRVTLKQAEKKYNDVKVAYTNIGAGGYTALLTDGITQGVGANSRVGDRLKPVKLEFRITAYQNNTTSVQPPNIIRVILFQWDQNAGATPAVGDVLEYASLTNPGESICSPYKWINLVQKNLHVLKDFTMKTTLNGNSAYHKSIITKRMRDVEYATAGSSTVYDQGIYALIIADDAGVVSPCPSFSLYSRLTYVDI